MSIDILDALSEHLLGITGVTTLVGQRVYPQVPQSPVYPYVLFSRDSTSELFTLVGSSGLPSITVRTEIWGRGDASKTSVMNVYKALRKRSVLHGYRGLMGTYFVHCCRFVEGSDDDLPPPHGEGRETIGFAVNVSITFEDATPA